MPGVSDYVPGYTALKNQIQNGVIQGINNLVQGQLTVRSTLSSASAPSSYNINELGIFGKFNGVGAETLLAYASTGANTGDPMVPTGSGVPLVKDYALLMIFQRAISSSGVLQMNQIVNDHAGSHFNTGTDPLPYPSLIHSGAVLPTTGTGLQAYIDTNPPTWQPTLLVIPSNSTLYVTTTGNDTTGVIGSASFPFASIQGALNKLQNYVILPGVTVLISAAAGTWTSSTPITVNHPNAPQINIVGASVLTGTVGTSPNVSGSTGAWSITFNLSSASGISVGNYLQITSGVGTQDFHWFDGVWKVTAVSGNNVTVLGTQRRSRFGGTNATSGTFKAFTTILQFNGCDGFDMVNCSLGLLDQVAIAGNSTATTRGIYSPAGTQVTSGVVGINGFDFGVYLTGTGANLNGGTVYACGNLTAGLSANYGAAVNLTFSICSGNGSYGAYAQAGSVIAFGAGSTFSNNLAAGVYISVATAFVNSCNVTGNNVNGIECLNGGSVAADICNCCVNVSADYFAFNAAFITSSTHQAYAGSGVVFNPAQNTQGGNFAVITGS